MYYLLVLPSLLCGLILSREDARTHTVPRLWVLAGFLVQLAVLAVAAGLTHDIRLAALPPCYGLAAGAIQLLLAHIKRGTLGFGDVTATAMAGQAVGVFGLETFLIWWLMMGVLGLFWTGMWNAHGVRKAAFVPVIVCSAAIAVATTVASGV